MGRKNFNAYIKRQKAEEKRKKKEKKRQRLEARKQEDSSSKLEDMIAYVDEDGNIISDPPEEEKVNKEAHDDKDSIDTES